MTRKELDSWFNELDSSEIAKIFPSKYEKAIMSADPDVNINTFLKNAKSDWKLLPKEEKERIFKSLNK